MYGYYNIYICNTLINQPLYITIIKPMESLVPDSFVSGSAQSIDSHSFSSSHHHSVQQTMFSYCIIHPMLHMMLVLQVKPACRSSDLFVSVEHSPCCFGMCRKSTLTSSWSSPSAHHYSWSCFRRHQAYCHTYSTYTQLHLCISGFLVMCSYHWCPFSWIQREVILQTPSLLFSFVFN